MTVSTTWVALVCVALLAARPLKAANADITLQSGLYQGIVLGIHPDMLLPDDPATFLQEIQSFLEAGSQALSAALDGGAALGDVKLVLPRSWDKTNFGTVNAAVEDLTIASADILIHNTTGSLPSTLQAEQCGVPGRQIEIPLSFLSLTPEEEGKYGTTGHILAHEWAHYRYGVHDEHGYTNDPVYSPAYGDPYTPTACTVGALAGAWRTTCTGASASCQPNRDGCYFCIDDGASASAVQASLGYLPALSTGRFCNSTTHNRHSPSPQNLLCGRRSVMQVIEAHPDYQNMHEVGGPGAGSIEITLYEEPLGRVMLLLDTPPDSGEVLSYTDLLNHLQGPLAKYNNQLVSLVSFKYSADDDVEVVEHRSFISFDLVKDSLSSYLPEQEPRTSVPDLALVLEKVLQHDDFASEYSPGTLLVVPATNELMGAAKLGSELGNTLRRQRIKPLFLFPEGTPALAGAGSFLQSSGARFISRNDTDATLNDGTAGYASMAATDEVYAFVDNTFQRDHAIVTSDVEQLSGSNSFTSKFWYQGQVAQDQLAVLTTSGDISQLKLKYYHFTGLYKDCVELGFCTVTDDSIFFHKSNKQAFNFPTEPWHLEVENTGPEDVQITLTRSIVNFVRETEEELTVDVWASDGRGPVAALSNNAMFVLYASVSNRGKQVLGSNIHVLADVVVQRPGDEPETIVGLQLLDNGTIPDIRKDDSVYSAYLAAAPFETGTVVTVNSVTIASHTILGELSPFATRHRRHQASAATARLFSRDPEDEQCCGSFVEDPNIEVNHRTMGFYLRLPEPIKPIEVSRIPTEGTTTTTTTAATTTTTTGLPGSTTVLPGATTVLPGSTTVHPATTTVLPATPTTQTPTTTAGVSTLEKSLKVLLQTALVLYIATLMH